MVVKSNKSNTVEDLHLHQPGLCNVVDFDSATGDVWDHTKKCMRKVLVCFISFDGNINKRKSCMEL